jgi:CheY-like chemotaxis protein/HPt (histidine-containing phosphotransfer) domain-containing protein
MMHEAVEHHDPFRIALLDQQMPGMDGVELGYRIKADHILKATLTIMITSLGQRGDVAALKQIGFAGYLHKPVRQSELYGCLELVLGRASAGAAAATGIVTRHTVAETVQRSARILLAEDNPINQKVAQSMLNKLGYKSDVVANGLEAVRALELICYDLVLMDCLMPELDGYEATAMIRDSRSKVLNHDVPIIAMTANAMEGDREKCLEAGMNDYLSKPAKKEELAEILATWLGSCSSANASDRDSKPGTSEINGNYFDEVDLIARLDCDRDFVRVILGESLEEIPQQVGLLHELCKGEDLASIRRQAHTLKGLAANISTPGLRNAAMRVESAAKESSLETVLALLPELEKEALMAQEAIRESGVWK